MCVSDELLFLGGINLDAGRLSDNGHIVCMFVVDSWAEIS